MTIEYKDNVSEQLPASDTTIYTCPTGIKSAHVIYANATSDGTASTIAINIVKSGGSVGVDNVYLGSRNIVADSTDGLSEIVNAVLKSGDFISGIAGTATALNVKIGVKEIS